MRKKAQEEMIGFALIVIIVAVIIMVLISFLLRSSKSGEIVESYEIESFIQASLQYTTDCAEAYEPNYLSVQRLIIRCMNLEKCLNEKDACEVLNSTLNTIMEESWKAGENSPVKGYALNISSSAGEILFLKKGNSTNNYKAGIQDFAQGGDSVEVFLIIYY